MGTSPPPYRDPVFKEGEVLDGRYRIAKVIGEGGMGTVYQAEHVLIKRRVAVKLLHSEYTTDPEVIERFMNEAKAAGTLGHPNIVESTDMGFARDSMPYIVFEYLEGSPLSDEVYRLRGLTVRRALRIAHQIASALDAAHSAGIVHRDLKSDNVFLTHREDVSDHVKVIDFGISRFVQGETTGVGKVQRALVMGTPEFMAPEQMTAPESVDHRADIYALGVVLYEMLAGRTPFINNNDIDALVHQILLETPPPIDRKEIPPGLNELIFERLLAKDPAKRFQTMKEVKAAVEAFWGASRRDSQPIEPIELPVAAQAAAAAPAPAEAIALPKPPKKRASIVPLVLALACAGVGAFLMSKSGKRVAKPDAAALSALDTDAANIASAIDAVANEVKLRAQGVATTPMLRAAIVTDAATVQDMVRDGVLVPPGASDVMELVQLRDGKRTPLIRLPATAPEIPDPGDADDKADLVDGQLRIVASAPVARSGSKDEAGAVVVASPVDLASVATRLKDHVLAAQVTGFKAPIVLVPAGKAAGDQVTRPIAPRSLKGANLALVATIASVMPPDTYTLPAVGCFAAGGLLLLIFVVGFILHRSRARGHT